MDPATLPNLLAALAALVIVVLIVRALAGGPPPRPVLPEGPAEPKAGPSWLAVALVVVVAVVILAVVSTVFLGGVGKSLEACREVERLLAEPSERPPSRGARDVAAAELIPLELPGAAHVVEEGPMDIRTAAGTRHDPKTLSQLRGHGFQEAYRRAWLLDDGLTLSAVVFEFRDRAGALGYQADVSRYACQFANEAYRAPGEGIGLQVRRSGGRGSDPTDEQIAWVTGRSRVIVNIRWPEPPPDHRRIESFARLVVEYAERRLGVGLAATQT